MYILFKFIFELGIINNNFCYFSITNDNNCDYNYL